jgi:hypothetical protein
MLPLVSKTKAKLVRLDEKENEQLERTAHRLGLSVSEVLRRSWRISAPQFYKLTAPGVARAREASDD